LVGFGGSGATFATFAASRKASFTGEACCLFGAGEACCLFGAGEACSPFGADFPNKDRNHFIAR
jgi:hypothetical protein